MEESQLLKERVDVIKSGVCFPGNAVHHLSTRYQGNWTSVDDSSSVTLLHN